MSTARPTLEHVVFRLRPDADPASFDAANAWADAFLSSQPGFVARELARQDDGAYVDLVWWSGRDAAEAATAAYLADPASTAFGAIIDPDSVVSAHLDIVRDTRLNGPTEAGRPA